jgi:Reverse transcriptase (RNA-dependent DNA polymerase)
MDLHARLSEPRRYQRELERLHAKHLRTHRLYELRQSEVPLASFVLNRARLSRLIAGSVAGGQYEIEPAQIRTIVANGKLRTVFAFRLSDLLIHGVVAGIIEEVLAPRLSSSLYSYRKAQSWWTATAALASYFREHRRAQTETRCRGLYVLRRDIDSYTDSIPVGDSSPVWRMLRGLFEAPGSRDALQPADWRLLERVVRPEAFAESGELFTQFRGAPTGQPISCVLFNLYLSSLDADLEQIPGGFYARYCDDFVFAHPDASVARAVDSRIRETLAPLYLTLNESKSRDLYLTGAGRRSEEWPEAKGTTVVPFLGCLISAHGTVALSREKRRRLLADLRHRALRTARAAKAVSPETTGRLVCGVINRALSPRLDFPQQRSASLLRRVVTDRADLRQLDYSIARIVLEAVTGRSSPQEFRQVPYRKMREKWALISLCQARNKWARGSRPSAERI